MGVPYNPAVEQTYNDTLAANDSNASNTSQTLDKKMEQDASAYFDACDVYDQANAIYASDMEIFNQLAATDPMAALVYFLEKCCGDLLSCEEAQMNIFSASMDISNDLLAYNTDAENMFNSGGNISSSQANELYEDVEDTKTWVNFLSGNGTGTISYTDSQGVTKTYDAPLNVTDATSITSNLDSIENQFSNTKDNLSFTPESIQAQMKTWFDTSTTSGPVGNQPTNFEQYNQQIKTVQQSFQQTNSSVGSLSSSQQTNFQFYMNQYNQMVSSINSLMTSEIDQENAMINNQKPQ